jgi:glycerophosphoryl diester phosphodiesterase
MLILAHRGLHVHAEENTLDAFSRAVVAGFDGIETDVQITSTGELILLHDVYTADGARVNQFTRDELSTRIGVSVPLLAEALEEPADILWNLEIKERAVVPRLIRFLRPLIKKRRFLVSSFIHSTVCDIVASLDIDGGLIIAHDPITLPRLDEVPYCDFKRLRALICDYATIDLAKLEGAATAGLRTYLYNIPPIVAPRDFAFIDGLITDYPDQHLSREA